MNMNRQMKLPEIQKIMQEFEKQSEIMDMKEEMMNDVMGKCKLDSSSKKLTIWRLMSRLSLFCRPFYLPKCPSYYLVHLIFVI